MSTKYIGTQPVLNIKSDKIPGLDPAEGDSVDMDYSFISSEMQRDAVLCNLNSGINLLNSGVSFPLTRSSSFTLSDYYSSFKPTLAKCSSAYTISNFALSASSFSMSSGTSSTPSSFTPIDVSDSTYLSLASGENGLLFLPDSVTESRAAAGYLIMEANFTLSLTDDSSATKKIIKLPVDSNTTYSLGNRLSFERFVVYSPSQSNQIVAMWSRDMDPHYIYFNLSGQASIYKSQSVSSGLSSSIGYTSDRVIFFPNPWSAANTFSVLAYGRITSANYLLSSES